MPRDSGLGRYTTPVVTLIAQPCLLSLKVTPEKDLFHSSPPKLICVTIGGSNIDGRILIVLAVLSTLQSAHAACTSPDCAPAEGWDNFANNLGSDLAPLLALFGEQVTTQYLSETMDVSDCLLFALAPLGIITAIVAAIRVSGSSKLRAIIGRAKETRGDVEADLMSSTSSDVCELWSGEDVVRVIGKPVLLQLVYNETKAHGNDTERIVDLEDGILNFQDQATKQIFYKPQPKPDNQVPEKPDSQSLVQPANQGPAQSANQSLVQPTNQDPALEQSRYSDIESWQARNNPPNLSLNVSIKPITRGWMAIYLIVGFLAQGAVLTFAAVSQYKLRLPKNDSFIPSYAFPVFLLGTVTLAGGMFLCARVVETSTQETVWEPKNADTTRVVWLQQGGQKVGDQVFESFARVDSQGKVYTSQKGEDGKKERTALAATAVCVTLVGFIAQFFGLRATHSSVIVLQLGAILVMTGIRSYAHSRRDNNNDIEKPDMVKGYELDWLAKNLGGCSTWEVMSLYHSDSRDVPVQSETASKPGESGASELPRAEVRENSGFTPATRLISSESGKVGAGENPNTEPLQASRMPQSTMSIRSSLAGLSIDWDLNSRKCVAVLKSAIQESMNDVFTKMELNQKNCNEPSFEWCIPVTARPKTREGAPLEPGQNCAVSLILERKKDETGSWGEWGVKNEELEAVLCLWVSSLTEFDRKQAQNVEVRPKQIRLLGPATLASPIDYKFWIHRGAELRRTKLSNEQERYFGWRGSLSDEYLCVEADHVDLEALCAQTLYTLFLGRLARWVDGVGGTTTIRRANDSNSGPFASMEDDNSWKHFHLSNSNFASLAEIFVRCGLGTIEEAYQCIISAFSSVEKPPYPDSVYTRARKASKTMSKEEKWKDVAEIDSWLCQNLLPTNAPVSVIHAEVTQRLYEGCKKLLLGIKENKQDENLRPVWDLVHTQCQVLSTAKLSDNLFFSMVTRCMTYWRFNNHSRADPQEFMEIISHTIEFITGRQDSVVIKENVEKGWNDKVFDQPESFARFLFDNQTLAGKENQDSLTFCVLLVRKDSGHLFSNEEITSYFNDPESLKAAANTTANGPFGPPSVHIPIDILLSRGHQSPLQQAAAIGNKQLVEGLLEAGAQVDSEPARYRGRTALQAAASEGQHEVVELLLARGADIKAEPASDNGRTALQAAAGAGHLEVVKLLCSGGVNGDPGENEGRTALQAAAEGGHREIMEFLLDLGADVNALPASSFGRTVLQAAAGAGHIDIVQLILRSKDVINTRAGLYWGRTALQAAAENGHEEIVELLLARGAHVDAEPAVARGRTALQAAAGAGHGEVVKQLLRAGANVNARAGDDEGRTALQAAVEGGHMNTVALLLAVDSDINAAPGKTDGITVLRAALDQGDPRMMKLILASDSLDVEAVLHSASESERSGVFEILKSGNVDWNHRTGVLKETPLHKAIQHRHDAVFELLVTVCEVNLKNAEGLSPLHLAVWLGNKHAVQRLVKNSEVAVNLSDSNRCTPIFIAASTGDVEIASLLLEIPSLDVNRASSNGRTPLHIAAINKNDMVTGLLFGREDLDVNIADITGSTPLHIASERGLETLVVNLLSWGGVNVNCCNSNGATPLMLAASEGESEIVGRLLARSDISINVGDSKGYTPLYRAAQGGHEVIVEQLLANGAIVSQRARSGYSALHAAAQAGYVRIVARLLSADDSEVDVEDDVNWTPLSCAARTGNHEIVKLLLAKNADVNHITEKSATPLLIAAQMGHDLVVESLLAAPEIKVNLTDDTGDTPLHAAAAGGHHSIVGKLLAKNVDVDVNSPNQRKETPLHYAAKFAHDLVVKELLMAPGINVNLLSNNDNTPLVIAASLGHHLIVGRLLARKDIDANGSGFNMPLLAAAIKGYAVIVDMLLEKVDVNQQDSDKSTALWYAALKGHDAVVQTILKRKTVDVDLANIDGATPLHVAAQNGHEGVVKMLLAREKIDVNFPDLDSVTPLIAAAKSEHVGVVQQLLKHKDINVNLVDGHGNTIPSHTFKGVVRGLLEKARTTQSVPKST